MTNHTEVNLELTIPVDAGIAELIKEIWNKGLITEYCCQGGLIDGHYQTAYILFPNIRHLAIFACFLDTNEIPYKSNFRELEYGGGGTVRFRPVFIRELIELLRRYPDDYWHREIIQKAKVYDYTERFKSNELSRKDAETWQSSQISNLQCSGEGW